MKVLVLEGKGQLSNAIAKALIKEGYTVDCFNDGNKVLDVLENGYSCFILDIHLPYIDGISILEAIRINHKNIPVIMMSIQYDFDRIKLSYDAGCDDYLKKPFYIFELVQKVKKLSIIEKHSIHFNDTYKFDCKNHILYKENKEIEITKKEILFLEFFTNNLHHVATYEEIFEYVWEGENTTLVNIRAMIKRLRKKILSSSIVTVKGVGYSLNKDVYMK